MSQSSNHLKLVSWTWQWVHFTQMASTVTRSQSNRAPLGCGGTGDLHNGCAADKSASNCVMLSCQYGPKSLRNVSNTLLNQCHKELKQLFCQVPLWSLIACFAICLHSKSVCVCPVPVRCWWDIVSTVPYCTHMLIVTLYTGSALNPLHLLISLSLFPWMLPNSSLHLKAKCKSFQWISKRPLNERPGGRSYLPVNSFSNSSVCHLLPGFLSQSSLLSNSPTALLLTYLPSRLHRGMPTVAILHITHSSLPRSKTSQKWIDVQKVMVSLQVGTPFLKLQTSHTPPNLSATHFSSSSLSLSLMFWI